MPKVIRKGIDASQSHKGCCSWPSTLPSQGNGKKVYAMNGEIVVVGNSYNAHKCKCGDTTITHSPKAMIGSPNVFIGGLAVHRDADSLTCGDAADNGATTVFANGGGSPGGTKGEREGTIGYTIGAPYARYSGLTAIDYRDNKTKIQRVVFVIPYVWVGSTLGHANPSPAPWQEFRPEIWTPIFQEDTNKEFKNYPPPPYLYPGKTAGAKLPTGSPPHMMKGVKVSITRMQLMQKYRAWPGAFRDVHWYPQSAKIAGNPDLKIKHLSSLTRGAKAMPQHDAIFEVDLFIKVPALPGFTPSIIKRTETVMISFEGKCTNC